MLSRVFNSLEETIICVLLAVMTILVFVEVVLRFGFGIGFMWIEELTLHLSAWMVLFGASYGIKVGSHIGVDTFVKMLPNKLHRLVSLGSIGCCLIYCGLFIKGSWVYLEKIHSIAIEMEDLPIPKWIAHSILLLGMIMLAWRLLQLLWEVYTGKTEGFKLADEAKESMHLAQKMPDQTAVGGGDTA